MAPVSQEGDLFGTPGDYIGVPTNPGASIANPSKAQDIQLLDESYIVDETPPQETAETRALLSSRANEPISTPPFEKFVALQRPSRSRWVMIPVVLLVVSVAIAGLAAGLGRARVSTLMNVLKAQLSDLGSTASIRTTGTNRHQGSVSAKRYYRKGDRLYRLAKYPHAIKAFRDCLTQDADFALAHRGLGITYAAMRKYKSAHQEYKTYLRKQPNAADAGEVAAIIAEYERKVRRVER